MLFGLQSWEWFLGALISGATCNEFEKKRKKLLFLASKSFIPDSTFLQGFLLQSLSKNLPRSSLLVFFPLSLLCFCFIFSTAASFAAVTAPFPRSASSWSSKDIIHNALLRWVGPRVKCLFIGRGARLCSSVALILSPCRQIYFAALFEIEIKVFGRGGRGLLFPCLWQIRTAFHAHRHRRTRATSHSLLSSPLKLDLMQSAPLFLRSM